MAFIYLAGDIEITVRQLRKHSEELDESAETYQHIVCLFACGLTALSAQIGYIAP